MLIKNLVVLCLSGGVKDNLNISIRQTGISYHQSVECELNHRSLLLHLGVTMLHDSWHNLSWTSGLLGLALSLALSLSLGWNLEAHLLWNISDSLERFMHFILDSRLSLDLDLGLGLEQGAHSSLLLAHEWHGLQLLLPLLSDVDSILSSSLIRDGVSLFICMVDRLLHLLGIKCIPDVIEIVSITLATFGKDIRKVLLDQGLLANISIQVLDRNLIKEWRVDELDLVHLQQPLLALQDILHEVLRHHLIWHHVVLPVIRKV